MKFKLIIVSLFLTLSLSAQVKYSTTKTYWNFRTSNVTGQKPVSADFTGVTNGRMHNTADSVIWISTSGTISIAYSFYPYSTNKARIYPVVTGTSARYGTPKYQTTIRTSTIRNNVPLSSDFTDATVMCINWTDSLVYQKVSGVITRTWKIYAYNPLPVTTSCTYTYGPWGDCQTNGTRTRTLLSTSPSGCTGTPILSESCTYTPPVCTYTYSTWGTCQSNGTQSRTVVSSSPAGCTGTPVLTQNCTYIPPTCTYTYSAWGACQSDSSQTRTVIDSTPGGCLGTPVLKQKCNYVAPDCSYTYSSWSECSIDGKQTRTIISATPGGCYGIPVLTQNCTYVPPACTYTYSDWGTCQSNNTQTRTVISSSPNPCTGNPVLSQSCVYVPPTCTYTYSDWGTCVNNVQTRTVVSSSPTGCAGTPVLSQSCTSVVPYGAHNYYFSSSTGSDSYSATQAHSSATPWKSITKLNAIAGTLLPGDSILFKSGDTFTGTLSPRTSGNSTSSIVFSSYGTGSQPIITGFTTITGWTNYGGGIYSKVITPTSSPRIVTIDGKQYAMGRCPNSGWLYFESHTGTTAITDNQLTGSPSWVGAEVVIRKNDWDISHYPITAHATTTLTFTGNTGTLTDNYGYYIQNSLSALDQYGEWYYNPSNTTLYVYFGAVDPSTKTVQVTTIDKLVTFTSGLNYITFNNLSFKGSNVAAIWGSVNNYIAVKNCSVDFSGNIGLRFGYCSNITIDNCTINHSNDQGIATWSTSNNVTIKNCTVKNTEIIPAHGVSDHMSGVGIFSYQGDNILIKSNSIDSTSYCGIIMGGNNQIVRKNVITNSLLNKQDGAGIYYGMQATYSNMTIDSNIVLHSVGGEGGKPAGTVTNGASGIYIDYGTTGGVTIKNNTVANCSGHGIFDHASSNLTITGNTCYNNVKQLNFQETPSLGVSITGLTVKNNKFIAKESTQLVFWGRLNTGNVWTGVGTLDSNYYARPISDATPFKAMVNVWDIIAQSLATFKGLTGQDSHSVGSPFAVSSTSNILFDYTTTTSKTVIGLTGYKDLNNNSVTSYTLQPYTSIILLK